MTPLVSVIIPTYNAETTIVRALDSVFAQTYRNLEITVVDDDSSDKTRSLVDAYCSYGVKLLTLDIQQGAGAARNLGIKSTNGEFIAFLDADDEWLPEKIEKQVAALAAAPDMSFIACAAVWVSDICSTTTLVNQDKQVIIGGDAWKALLAYSFVATPCVMVRRSKLDVAGHFDTSFLLAEDQDLWIRLALRGDVGCLGEILVRVHDMPDSATKRYRHAAARETLRLVSTHLNNLRFKLTTNERRWILGHRYSRLGRNLYVGGEPLKGILLVLRSIYYGNAPIENVLYLISAARPVRWLKRMVNQLFL